MAKLTRGQKAAKTLGSEHFAAIGAKGGTKTPGTFQTKPGFAERAGKLSGLSRKIKAHNKNITELEKELAGVERPDDRAQIYAKIEAEKREIADTSRELEKARASE